jgi:four helix bundle protein
MSYKVTKVGSNASSPVESFQTFEDLEVYKAAREFRKAMYAPSRRLPDFEKYELGRQIRRAAVSLTNNIAEGHGRFHYPDQMRFVLHSRGSLQELVDDLNVCLDENYLSDEQIEKLKEQARGALLLINGYLRHLRRRSTSIRETDEGDSELLEELDDLLPL